MDELDFFTKKIRMPYDLDGILGNHYNYKEGSFYNEASEDYKKRINHCYMVIEDDLKMDLVDFVDEWLPILKAELIEKERNVNVISTKTDRSKNLLFSFRTFMLVLKAKLLGDEPYIKVVDVKSDCSENFLLAFTKRKYNYLDKWVEEKRIQTEKLYQDILSENTKENKIIDFSENQNNQILKWYGTQAELIELTKALIENGNLKGKQEDIFDAIQKIYNIKLNNIDQAITKFNSRNQENETKFLDTLKMAFSKYIKTKLEKNR